MTGDPGPPASIAAIMAAIRGEMAAAEPGRQVAADGESTDAPAPPAGALATEPVAVAPAGSAVNEAAASAMLDKAALATAVAPLLKVWLDANLPEIVEAAVDRAIRRLTGEDIDIAPPRD